MEKRGLGILFLLLLILLAGCQEEQKTTPKEQLQEEQVTPEIRLMEYISHWEQGNFSDMYDGYLTEGTRMAFETATFVDWQKQLHQELAIQNLKVTYVEPEEEVRWSKEQPADFRVRIKMDTVAGPVEFDRTLTMLFEAQGEKEDWFAEWNPSFIFPQLEEGDTVEIERSNPERGELHDRNGKPIAVNGKGFEVGVVPANFDEAEKKNDLAALLNITPAEVDQKLGQSWVQPGHYVPLAVLPTRAEEALQQIFSIPGTERREVQLREYPYGEALSHVSGFTGPITAEQLAERKGQGYGPDDLIGRQGLEEALEDRLRGEQGVRVLLRKSLEGIEPIVAVEKTAKQGEIIKLTIDAELQKKVYQAMKGKAGASAAVDPKTGEALVLLSSPGFDPNAFVRGIKGSEFSKLQNDRLKPLYPRFTSAYVPGAVIEPVIIAIGMAAGLESSKEIGPDALQSGLKDFGFGEEIASPLNLAVSQVSNSGTLDAAGQLSQAKSGKGQMQVNLLHLVSMYEPFVTEGTIYKPTLLLEEETEIWKEGLLDAEQAASVRKSLRNANGNPSFAEKSGMVQNGKGELDYVVSFNHTDPEFILAIMVERAEIDGSMGDLTAMSSAIFGQ
ncbi:penicillin-binding transpeptidase domain-containing protein [Planomicrobium chinense]|uniref:penicillin-binding transpeptidase domain-containing protein n=1 Tax=Planococcus chinensis TaxID=272917 RepID=UPI001CC724D8|nr:penicillin-binding transpeptidase domain-containing protein [Planococcus chinensis]MBZ5202696.1 penicillin-binding transpeptidase domain-containing protein [Planococcus chinensis]